MNSNGLGLENLKGSYKPWRYQIVMGQQNTMIGLLASWPSCPNSQRCRNFSEEKNVAVAEVNQQRWLEESGQRVKNVDQPI